MRHRSEPAIATAILKLFCSNEDFDSAVGDLMEQYQHGRSRVWYWRQVVDIVCLAIYSKIARRPLAPTDRVPAGQALLLILPLGLLAAVLVSDIWLIAPFGILGGGVAGLLIYAREHYELDRPPADLSLPRELQYHRGISMQHIPVEGAVGLLFVVGTLLIFGLGIAAVREILIVTVPLGISGGAYLSFWHKGHPVKYQGLGLRRKSRQSIDFKS